MPTQPEKESQAKYDEEAGGYNEASEAYNLGLADKPPAKPKAPPPEPKSVQADPREQAAQLMNAGRFAEAQLILDKIKEDEYKEFTRQTPNKMAKGGKISGYAKGGKVKAAKGRGDGCCTKGKTKGRFV